MRQDIRCTGVDLTRFNLEVVESILQYRARLEKEGRYLTENEAGMEWTCLYYDEWLERKIQNIPRED